VLIPLVPFETKAFDSVLRPNELVAAVQTHLKDGVVVGTSFFDQPLEYRGLAHGSHVELWRVVRKQTGYFPIVRALVAAAPSGSRLSAVFRPQWDVILPTAVGLALAAVAGRVSEPPASKATLLTLLACAHVTFYLATWLPERARLVRLLRRLCAAEL
jgi:hypothetical protein